jgi:hypothetical protein
VSDREAPTDGATSDDRAAADRQRGPWALALGTLAIGVLAVLVAGARALRRRVRDR